MRFWKRLITDINSITIFSDNEVHKSLFFAPCVSKYLSRKLLFGYAVNSGSVSVVDIASGEEIPREILAALSDPGTTKWAFNANFERTCLSNWLKQHHPEHFTGYSIPEDPAGAYLNPSSWKCSMIWSAYLALPLSLAGAGAVLGLEEQKLTEGKDLIRYFCVPCRPTKANGG